MSFMESIRQEFRNYRSPAHLTNIRGRKSRMKVENFNGTGGDEVEWEIAHIPNDTSQILDQLRSELRTDWDRGLVSVTNRMNAGHQKCLHALTDHIEQTIRRTIEEYLVGQQDDVQPLPSRRASPEPSDSQLLLESAEPEHKTQVEDLTAMLQRTQAELENVKSRLKASEDRADQLRSIIVPRDEEPMLDSEIQKVFSEIRTATQWVAERLFSKSRKYLEPTTIDSAAFFEEIESLAPECRQDAIHAHLSTLIRQRFFPNSVGDSKISGKYENLQKLLVATERDMMDAVAARHPKGTAGGEMANWTRVTFKCLDLLVDRSDEADSYAVHLEQFFKPAETDDVKSQNIGRKKLKVLCEKANEFGILLRRSEHTFQVFTIKKDVAFKDCEKKVEELRCNRSRTIIGVKVVDCCLYGGLKKISREYPSKAIYLERAQVSTRFIVPDN
ncbi:hypothetical protein NOF04DRAFT_9437 [Fusarium oxysporum II5]|uniref:Uncharacterized protein n=3 Tax=Fusarium oxysporum species complex TaxID=171631 RepID=N1S5X2_FUSC4|nr:uncharacterized protein FOIG_11124 [Fusarium odoratissimum NRRL 54006]EMT72961.1 hypothetical protein FOC4_g10000396 [Fusarium odoratissimum]EXL96765.1 hypothetical protein FOIG_11124 [Fusarium odoratissimum NRRL 54006]KAK2136083.1 hypothetical protein NOF04DRAFT_9437 [Fusarium oxysporum II5]